MTTLYIDRKDTRLTLQGDTLVSYINEQRQRPVPLALIERLVIISNIELTSLLLGKLAAQGITVSFINLRKGGLQATLIGADGKNPIVRLAQYQASMDLAVKHEIARQLITAKIRQHARLVRSMVEQRPEHRHSLQKTAEQLASTLTQLEDPQLDVTSLRGIEGNAARQFFQAYSLLLPSVLAFTGRNRRPPRDPVNAVLSLAYTLLHQRAVQLSYAAGFDPAIGFLHEAKYSRDSLAADLIEPWRPHIDRWVWQWFAGRYLRSEHFSQDKGACLLGKRGRAKFYAAFEINMRPLQRAMRWQLNRLKKELLKRYP